MRFTLVVDPALFGAAVEDVEFCEGADEPDAGGGANSLAGTEGIPPLCLWLISVGRELLSGADVGIMGGIKRAPSSTGMLLNGAGCAAPLSLFAVIASKLNRKRRSDIRGRTGEEETPPAPLEPPAWLTSNTGGVAWTAVPNRGNSISTR